MFNPITLYLNFTQPKKAHTDPQEEIRARATSFFCFWGFLAGSYSCIKWFKNGVPELYFGSLVLVFGPIFTILLIRYRTFSPIVCANLAVCCMSAYCGIVIYQLGAIHSPHILWTVGIIIFAYLLTGPKTAIIWSGLSTIFTLLLIIGDRNGYQFPYHQLNEKQALINQYSGYMLPMVLLWLAQSYSMMIRNNSLTETQAALAESKQLTQKSAVMSENLSKVIDQAGNSSNSLLSASDSLGNTVSKMTGQSENLSNGVWRQAEAVTSINTTLVNMANSVHSTTQSISNISQRTQEAEQNVILGGEAMNKAIAFMEQIRESNAGILSVMSVISDIADQTNLLALNASIEAARAGEHGRGFAVVADEVRSLSQKSNASAKKIGVLLDKASSDVNEGALIVNQAGEILTIISESVQEIARQTGNVNNVMIQQNKDIEGIVASSNEVASLSSENTSSSQELMKGSTELSDMAEKLSNLAHVMHEIVRSENNESQNSRT